MFFKEKGAKRSVGIISIYAFQEMNYDRDTSYGSIFQINEKEFCEYNFKYADAKMLQGHFQDYENECFKMIEKNLPSVAYEFCIKSSHVFNTIEARGVIGNVEREKYIERVRKMSKKCLEKFIELYKE